MKEAQGEKGGEKEHLKKKMKCRYEPGSRVAHATDQKGGKRVLAGGEGHVQELISKTSKKGGKRKGPKEKKLKGKKKDQMLLRKQRGEKKKKPSGKRERKGHKQQGTYQPCE